MKKYLIIICCILCFIITGCGKEDSKEMSSSLNDVLSKNNYIVVDVRTKEEYDEGHVVNSINIPYDEIDKNIDLDKTKTIMVYCKSGRRSSIAYQNLKSLGYDVIDLGAYDNVDLDKE